MAVAVNFRNRISAQRPYDRQSSQQDTPEKALEYLLGHLESDRGRIINCAAVRRLQQKTQVFPLERNAAVRSRLTHSLEVQQNGRFIVKTLFKKLGDDAAKYGLDDHQGAVESLVEMACLAHDIGNPPFGHFGESAIGEWFEHNLSVLFPRSVGADDALRERMLVDLETFEGNAQAIRLMRRLNLTFSQTACLLKYLRPAYAPRPQGVYRQKKPGFYLSEEAFVSDLRTALGMESGCRFPLTYVMEAADDISYCLADLEDAVEKGIFTIELLASELIEAFAACGLDADAPIPGASRERSFRSLVQDTLKQANKNPINKDGEFFIWLRVNLVHPLVQHAAQQFVDHIEQIYHGTLDRALLEDDGPCHGIIETFKDVASKWVYRHPEVETLLLQGHRIIQGLLEFYRPLLQLPAEDFTALAQGKRVCTRLLQMLASRIPGQHLRAYMEAIKALPDDVNQTYWEFYYRCRMMQDFVSGMTDQHAQDEYRALSAL